MHRKTFLQLLVRTPLLPLLAALPPAPKPKLPGCPFELVIWNGNGEVTRFPIHERIYAPPTKLGQHYITVGGR